MHPVLGTGGGAEYGPAAVKRILALVFVLVLAASLAPAASAGAAVGFNATALEVGGQPLDVAVGDLDGKNGPDIVTALAEGGLSVQLNNGNGTFSAPHLYPTGCPTYQVELADVTTNGTDLATDGRLDAVVLCVINGGDLKQIGRMAGDGVGGFGPLHVSGINPGYLSSNLDLQQSFALAALRAPGLPPVPVFTYSTGSPSYETWLCTSYGWSENECLAGGAGWPNVSNPIVAGAVAQARVFTFGGTKGILAWGVDSTWHVSTRELAPSLPTTAENFHALTIGDLAGDGPDIISSAGTCGCGYKDDPPSGQVDVLYGNNAEGVPDQVGTKFASAPGVTSIATGDFSVDGKEDLIGNSWSCDPATIVCTGAVFVQEGDGKGGLGPPQMFPLAHNEAFSRAPIRVADLDGNGSPDAVAIVGGKVQVLLNTQAKPKAVVQPLSGIKGLPKVVAVDKNGNLILGTATNPPTASVDLTVLLPPGGKSGKARASAKSKGGHKGKKKPKVIGHADIKIPAGHTSALKVHLKGSAVSELKHGKSLKTKLAIVAVGTDGTTEAKTQSLTIKPPKAKKHHH